MSATCILTSHAGSLVRPPECAALLSKKAAARRLELVHRAGEIAWAPFLAAIARIDRKDPQFIPHPSTWLNEGRYLDALTTGPPTDVPPESSFLAGTGIHIQGLRVMSYVPYRDWLALLRQSQS